MYTKHIWGGLETETGILGKPILTHCLKETCLSATLCSKSNTLYCARGVHSAKTKPDYSKSPMLKCLRQPFIIERYVSEKYWLRKTLPVLPYIQFFKVSSTAWAKLGMFLAVDTWIFASQSKGKENHFVTSMKTPCTFWQTQVPPGCLLAMKLFHISFIIGERQENTSSFLLCVSKLVKTTETQFH